MDVFVQLKKAQVRFSNVDDDEPESPSPVFHLRARCLYVLVKVSCRVYTLRDHLKSSEAAQTFGTFFYLKPRASV